MPKSTSVFRRSSEMQVRWTLPTSSAQTRPARNSVETVLRKELRVQRNRNADDAVHRMLQQTLGEQLTSNDRGDACIDGETLAAWVERSLPAARASLVEAHLSECPRCQSLMAAFTRTVPLSAPAPSFWQRWRLRWLVPIAAAATAVSIW